MCCKEKQMIVKKSLIYMAHEGGTKFYEVASFCCLETNRFVNVRRWGAMRSVEGGGEIKMENLAGVAGAAKAASTVASAKKSRGYYVTDSKRGLKNGTDEFEHDMLSVALHAHYNDPGTVAAILNNLDIDPSEAYGDDDVISEDDEDDKVEEIEKPEPVRSTDWASW